MDEYDGIDPKAFFEEQKRIFGEEKREGQDYEDFCRACSSVLSTETGQSMLAGLKRIIHYGSSSFRTEDGYNTHAAAARDGAQATITEILIASRIGNKTHAGS